MQVRCGVADFGLKEGRLYARNLVFDTENVLITGDGDIKLGDTIIVDGYRAKDGSHLMDARRVTLPDGRIVSGGSAGDGGPGTQ